MSFLTRLARLAALLPFAADAAHMVGDELEHGCWRIRDWVGWEVFHSPPLSNRRLLRTVSRNASRNIRGVRLSRDNR